MKQMNANGILIIATVVLILSAVSLPTAMATSLEYYGIEDIIENDMSIRNTITLKFTSPINHLEYQLGMKVNNLTTTSNFESADCYMQDRGEKSVIICDFRGMTKEKNQLKLKFNTKDGITKDGNNYKFSVDYGVSLPVDRLFVIVKLPENSILAGEQVNQSFIPATGKTLSDGKRIGVYWESTNLTTGDNLRYSVSFSTPLFISGSLIIAMTAIIIVVMVGLGLYLRKGTKNHVQIQHVTVPDVTPAVSVLNHDEKKVVDILKGSSGSAGQKHIVREGDFSKAKVSRLVKSLKERGVIEVEPISGRENRIILKLKGDSGEYPEMSDELKTNDSN